MSLIGLIVFIIVIGVVLWLISIAPFLDEQWKTIARWLIIAIAVIWLLYRLLGTGVLGDVRI